MRIIKDRSVCGGAEGSALHIGIVYSGQEALSTVRKAIV